MDSVTDHPEGWGFPIRTSPDQSSLAAPRRFSQRATSFIASWRQGIHQMPFIAREIHFRPVAGARARCQMSGIRCQIPDRTARSDPKPRNATQRRPHGDQPHASASSFLPGRPAPPSALPRRPTAAPRSRPLHHVATADAREQMSDVRTSTRGSPANRFPLSVRDPDQPSV
jgi:hypothetical protein